MTGTAKWERGPRSQGRPHPPYPTNGRDTGASAGRTEPPIDKTHPPYWNDDPRTRWLGPLNVGYALIDGQQERVLIDSRARGNAVTPEFVKERGLKVSPVSELAWNPRRYQFRV